jgi:branched-subunit amino acid transport protein
MAGEQVVIILGMGLATYLLRIFPFLLVPRFSLPPRLVRWFQCLSYCIIASFVWYGLAKGALAPVPLSFRSLALGLTILIAVRVKSALAGMAAGVLAVLIFSGMGW